MDKICLSTTVDENYEDYIPLFIYCARKAYPNYDIRIFRRGQRPFAMFPKYPYNTIAMRFVVPPEYYHSVNWVYVTDIDMMIMKEDVSLHTFHLAEMADTGLCYSNSLRNKNHYLGNRSLTGLHFMGNEWLDRTEECRNVDYNRLKHGYTGAYREYDGVMLYRMAKRSELGLPKKYKLYTRHHGIHLGSFRLYKKDPMREQKLYQRITKDYARQWLELLKDPDFKELVDQASENEMIREQLVELEKVCKVVR